MKQRTIQQHKYDIIIRPITVIKSVNTRKFTVLSQLGFITTNLHLYSMARDKNCSCVGHSSLASFVFVCLENVLMTGKDSVFLQKSVR